MIKCCHISVNFTCIIFSKLFRKFHGIVPPCYKCAWSIILFIQYHYEDDRQHFNITKLAIISIRFYAQSRSWICLWHTQGKLLLLLTDTRAWKVAEERRLQTFFPKTFLLYLFSTKHVFKTCLLAFFLNCHFHGELCSTKFSALKTKKILTDQSSLFVNICANIILYNTTRKNDKIMR